MKKPFILTIVTIVLVLIAVSGVVFLRNSQEATRQNAEASRTNDAYDQTATPLTKSEEATTVAGTYSDYTEASFENNTNRRILFFHAKWCPQCKMIDEDIKEQTVPDGVSLYKVDYDTNQDLRQKYGVTLQTTFVEVDSGDKKVRSYVAYNEPTFDSVKKNLIEK